MLTSVFGISIKYEAWNHQDSLPVYIAGSYDFQTAYIGNRRCIMLAPIEELATLPALKKQIAKIQQIEVVADMNDLRKLVSEYGKIGSNLNQIAKHFNSGGSQSRAIENEIHQCITDLFLLRKEVLKLAGGMNGNRKTH